MKVEVKKYLRFRSSIYGRVVFIITLLSIIFFLIFGTIFQYVYREYLSKAIYQCGNNVGSIVEGALYYSMLTNDKGSLKSTLDNLNTISGIDEVNMYNSNLELVYSTSLTDSLKINYLNCKECHSNFSSMFSRTEKSYQIIDAKSACIMNQASEGHRQLLINKPILNEPTCYTASCHAHQPTDIVLGSLIIKMPLTDLDQTLAESSIDFYALATVTTLLLVLSLIFFTRSKIQKPLHSIIRASEAVAEGDREMRLEIKPNLLDDMKLVSVAFNKMLDNLNAANKELENWSQQLEYKVQKKSDKLVQIQKELVHIERIASLGKLSSSVAHEINNPLSGVLTYTKLVYKLLEKIEVESPSKESMLKYLRIIESETKRCGEIVKNLLDFSRKDVEHFEVQSLHKILNEVFDLMSHQFKISGIHFYSDFNAMHDKINCRDNQIKQACIAILVNSSEAVLENGEICIKTQNPDNDHIQVDITDNGIGIDSEDIPHIFEPFYSAKQKINGVGLGLAIVHGIIQNHKGKIEVDSVLGKRTTLSIYLPLIKN